MNRITSARVRGRLPLITAAQPMSERKYRIWAIIVLLNQICFSCLVLYSRSCRRRMAKMTIQTMFASV